MTFASNSLGPLPRRPSKKKDDGPPGPDILHNLFDQVEDTAVGLFTMPWHVGKGVYSDAKTLATGGDDFKTDDALEGLVTTTWDDFRKRWEPLVDGDLPEFWNAVEEDPLGIILDVATVATAGAAGAGKAAQGATAAGKGLGKASLGFGKTNAELAGLRAAGIFDEAVAARVAETGLDAADTAAALRSQIEAKGGVVDPMGQIWERDTAILKHGEADYELPLARNPLVRARQRAGVAVSNSMPDAFAIGSNARVNRRRWVRDIMNPTRRNIAKRNRRAEELMRRLRKEEGEAAIDGLTVANFRQQGASPEMAAAYFGKQSFDAAEEAAEKLGTKQGGRVSPKDGPNQANAAMRAQQRTQRIQAAARYADEANWSPLFRSTMEELADLSRRNTRDLWELKGRPDVRRKGEAVAVRDKDAPERTAKDVEEEAFEAFWDQVAQRELEFMLRDADVRNAHFSAKAAEAGLDPDVPHIFRDVDGNEIDSTVDAVELARMIRQATPRGRYAFVRPHTSEIDTPKAISDRKKGRKGDGAKPDETKHNTGYNFQHAFDLFTPEGLLAVTEHVFNYKAARDKLDIMMSTGKKVGPDEVPPRGWVEVEDGDLRDYAIAFNQFVNEDLAITFGDGPVVQNARSLAERLGEMVAGEGALYVPPSVYKTFKAEVKSTNEFLKHYDNLTGFWRSWTLTMRPTWITGNLFGGLIMLLATHGLAKGLASYFQMWRMGSKNAHLDRYAPDVLSAGLVRSTLDDFWQESPTDTFAQARARHTAEGSKAPGVRAAYDQFGRLQAKIGEVNAWLTDDAVRRAAFFAEIKPHVRKIQKERPDLTFDEAAELFLSDPKVVDDLAQKVLDDLVNFRDLTQMERNVLRRFFPFWSWIKGASGRSARMAMDEPWKAWAAMEGARWGVEQTEEEIGGELPDYLQGALTIGDVDDGHVRIVPTNALNPFATLGDVAGMAKSALLGDIQVGGNNPASAMNPLIKSPVEAFTNRDLFYGTPLDRTGRSSFASRLALQGYHSFPQTRYIEKALQDGGTLSGSTLYKPSGLDQLISYFALPYKQLNVSEADERARAQESGLGANLI